jgi:hypothetical protein
MKDKDDLISGGLERSSEIDQHIHTSPTRMRAILGAK